TEDEIVVALDETQLFATDGLYLFAVKEGINILYVMGLLNSKLFIFLYRLLALETGRVMAQVKPTILNNLPIRAINFKDKTETTSHTNLVKLVGQIMACKKQFKVTDVSHEQTLL